MGQWGGGGGDRQGERQREKFILPHFDQTAQSV